MSASGSGLRAWLKPRNFDWGAGELFVMRLGIALAVLFVGVYWNLAPFEPEADKLNGLAKWIPLQWMLQPWLMTTLKVLTIAGLALFVLGVAPVFSLLPGTLALLGTGALRNSKGDIAHSTQALAMAVLAILGVYLAGAIRQKQWKIAGAAWHRRAMLAALVTLAAGYLASGVFKLKASRGKWIQRTPSMAVQMVKSNLADYYSKPEGDVSKVLTESAPKFLTERPMLTRCIFGAGLVLELGAILMLLGRNWAFLWGGALLAMHVGISILMKIEFWNHMALLALLCVLPGLWGLVGRPHLKTR